MQACGVCVCDCLEKEDKYIQWLLGPTFSEGTPLCLLWHGEVERERERGNQDRSQ